MVRYEVVYITGPPASGKTTLVKKLKRAFPNLRAFIYSELLTEYIRKRDQGIFSQRELRQMSAMRVTPHDVKVVDQLLIRQVRQARKNNHVLIDSHAVTKEGFGFRVTPFSWSFLTRLDPSRICMLFTDPNTVLQRIRKHSEGRPSISPFEANFHCFIQAAVAVNYGIQQNVPIYFYDNSKNNVVAFTQIAKWITTAP